MGIFFVLALSFLSFILGKESFVSIKIMNPILFLLVIFTLVSLAFAIIILKQGLVLKRKGPESVLQKRFFLRATIAAFGIVFLSYIFAITDFFPFLEKRYLPYLLLLIYYLIVNIIFLFAIREAKKREILQYVEIALGLAWVILYLIPALALLFKHKPMK